MNNGLVLLGGWTEFILLLALLVWIRSRTKPKRDHTS